MNKLAYVFVFFAISTVEGIKGSTAERPYAVLEEVFEDVMEVCSNPLLSEDCTSLIEIMRSADEYADPAIQYVISEALLAASGDRPDLLRTASEILDDLIVVYPENRGYQQQRMVVRSRADNLGAICEAQQAGDPGLLSSFLLRYLLTKQIERDIVATAIQQFDMNIADGEEIGAILTGAQMTLEKISDYGSETQSKEFMAHMKKTIPWDSWKGDRWSSVVASMQQPSAHEASRILYSYCHQLMVALDNGEFCRRAIELISATTDAHMLSDATLQMVISTTHSRLVEERPGEAGNAQDLLKALIDRMEQ